MALVIYSEIKTIFTGERGVKYLEAWAYLLDYLYKMGVILAVRIYNNKAIRYFRVQGPLQIQNFKIIRPHRSITFY